MRSHKARPDRTTGDPSYVQAIWRLQQPGGEVGDPVDVTVLETDGLTVGLRNGTEIGIPRMAPTPCSRLTQTL